MSEKDNSYHRSNKFDNDLVRRVCKELELDQDQQESVQRSLEEIKAEGGITPDNFNEMTKLVKEIVGIEETAEETEDEDQDMGLGM